MLTHLRAAIVSTLFFTLLLGVGYPLLVTGVGQLLFPAQAQGSLLRAPSGEVIGSRLLAQGFSRPEYLHPRPSAAGTGYDASASSGSNLGPLNPALIDREKKAARDLAGEGRGAPIPADAVTASASGLDPHITPQNARMQTARIAAARGVDLAQVQKIISDHVEGPTLGFLGQPRVNVLETNLALDAALPKALAQRQ